MRLAFKQKAKMGMIMEKEMEKWKGRLKAEQEARKESETEKEKLLEELRSIKDALSKGCVPNNRSHIHTSTHSHIPTLACTHTLYLVATLSGFFFLNPAGKKMIHLPMNPACFKNGVSVLNKSSKQQKKLLCLRCLRGSGLKIVCNLLKDLGEWQKGVPLALFCGPQMKEMGGRKARVGVGLLTKGEVEMWMQSMKGNMVVAMSKGMTIPEKKKRINMKMGKINVAHLLKTHPKSHILGMPCLLVQGV
jgi:hypothetical protein